MKNVLIKANNKFLFTILYNFIIKKKNFIYLVIRQLSSSNLFLIKKNKIKSPKWKYQFIPVLINTKVNYRPFK